MDARKRKTTQGGLLVLGRRVRARVEPEPDLDNLEDDASSGGAPSEQDVDQESGSESASASGDSSEGPDRSDGSCDESDQEDVSVDPSKVSFGALAKAQATLPPASRRQKKAAPAAAGAEARGPAPAKKERKPAAARSSKHAPMETTSKRPVGRRREVVLRPPAHTRPPARDPRFDPLVTGRGVPAGRRPADDDHARRAYAFLDEYRADEMRQLRAAVKKAATPAAREKLQRALMSMESRKKAQDKRAKVRALIDEHRKREKELVKEGKKANPFYLKKSEQKKQLLVDQFAGMSEKQREHAIERKRKKVTSKEKKTLPMERRRRE